MWNLHISPVVHFGCWVLIIQICICNVCSILPTNYLCSFNKRKYQNQQKKNTHNIQVDGGRIVNRWIGRKVNILTKLVRCE